MVIAVITSTESQAILFALLVAMFAHFVILQQIFYQPRNG